jgi:hypothetical protein
MKKRPMPLFNLSASSANVIYQVSLIALFIGTALALVSAVTLLWSGSIRERHMAERLAELEAAHSRETADISQARAQLAGANRQWARANAAAIAAEKEVIETRQDATVRAAAFGREITPENVGLFINFVKTVSKGRIIIEAIASNSESTHFARQIAAMLKSAGYDVEENYGSPTLLGTPPVGVEMKIRSMDEQPPYAGSLQRGLEFIGIETTGSLDTTAGDSVMIFVGTKP